MKPCDDEPGADAPRGAGCLIGTGDLGASVLEGLGQEHEFTGIFTVGFETTAVGRWIQGVPVLGSLEVLPRYRDGLDWAVVAVESGVDRARWIAHLHELGIECRPAIHPTAWVSAGATVLAGAIVGPRAVVSVGARIGLGARLDAAVVIEASATVGDYADVESAAVIVQRARIGERAHVGRRAVVGEEILVGPEARIAAGAVVDRDLAGGTEFPSATRPEWA